MDTCAVFMYLWKNRTSFKGHASLSAHRYNIALPTFMTENIDKATPEYATVYVYHRKIDR